MLSRLRISIDECEDAYAKFSKDILKSPNAIAKADNLVNTNGRFSTQILENIIKELMNMIGRPQSELFNNKRDDPYKM